MLQVDIAWAYGLGSSFAVAAQSQWSQAPQQKRNGVNGFLSWPFLQVLAVLILFLFTSAVHMLWAYPDWQTMYAARVPLPAWLVPLALIVIASAAILGFGIARALIARHKPYLAFLQFIAGYFFLFFGVMYGWDGTGYQRMLSTSRESFLQWNWSNADAWMHSEIALIFYSYAAGLVPTLLYLTSWWIKQGSAQHTSQLRIALRLIVTVFGVVMGSALLLTLSLIHLGVGLGLLVTAVYLLVALPYPWGLLARIYRWILDLPAPSAS